MANIQDLFEVTFVNRWAGKAREEVESRNIKFWLKMLPKTTRGLSLGVIDKVILAGMSANLCVEAHMRQLTEDGFEVTVVKDATAAANHPELGDGYQAALVNFGFIASGVVNTDEVTEALA